MFSKLVVDMFVSSEMLDGPELMRYVRRRVRQGRTVESEV